MSLSHADLLGKGWNAGTLLPQISSPKTLDSTRHSSHAGVQPAEERKEGSKLLSAFSERRQKSFAHRQTSPEPDVAASKRKGPRSPIPRGRSAEAYSFSEALEGHDRPSSGQHFEKGKIYPVIEGLLYFTVKQKTLRAIRELKQFAFLNPLLDVVQEHPSVATDPCPPKLSIITTFCRALGSAISGENQFRQLVIEIPDLAELGTTYVFLLACYSLLCHGVSPEQAMEPFTSFSTSFVRFSFAINTGHTLKKASQHRISLLQCLQGLDKAKRVGWFSLASFDKRDYEECAKIQKGAIHRVCPKIVLFNGCADLPQNAPDSDGILKPEACLKRFKEMQVKTVVRCNNPLYFTEPFTDAGLEHHDLVFDNIDQPPAEILTKFSHICEHTQGVIAVHCKKGLGRTGALLTRWLVATRGFTEGQAAGWLLLVRPGCLESLLSSFVKERYDEHLTHEHLTPAHQPASNFRINHRLGNSPPLTKIPSPISTRRSSMPQLVALQSL
eukprot:CAMPEP_0181300604 /NCGR_PEP_ID=MMETSP1101-20121128/6977_1 /TAXON_ID=46948 /ORGANISM="Rhodomonas abbreviata, Strain Caron Lab Isolate" /LENGTH=498 /DNA_ID=CAMNT_0023405849 /DNA_START=77 /DNA_END=1573 /DNA_ORIENTATION=-